MGHSEQAQKMYQQHHSERSQSVAHNGYGPSSMAARFRPPSTLQSTPSIEAASSFGASGQGFMESSHFSGSQMQGGPNYPQFTAAPEAIAYAGQHQQTAQYAQSPTYFYGGQQATISADQAAQDQMQRYQSAVGRNTSIASTSSQYSLPQTPQSQYFGSGQGGQYPSRTVDGSQGSSVSFDSISYTQASGYNATQQTSGQMLPPSSFGGYQQTQSQNHHQQHTRSLPEVDEAYEMYQNKAREIFTLVREGQLRETHDHLLYISRYLLGNAEALGLDKDDKHLYEERLKLWDMFNNTWLTTLQMQLDITRDMLTHGGQALRHPQSLLGADEMEELGQELVKLCDSISIFGLVDYQMGVAEEEILELLIKCLDHIVPLAADTPRQSGPQIRQISGLAH